MDITQNTVSISSITPHTYIYIYISVCVFRLYQQEGTEMNDVKQDFEM